MKAFISHTSRIAEYPRGYTLVQAAVDGVRDAGWQPDEMYETFQASPMPPVQEVERRVADCETFILIVGPFYGSRVPGRPDTSFVEFEYEIAVKNSKPILRFVLAPESVIFPANLLQRESDEDKDAQRRFVESIKSDSTERVINTASELRLEVLKGLNLIADRRRTPEGSLDAITAQYQRFISRHAYEEAFKALKPVLYDLDFRESRNLELLELLFELFPDGHEEAEPRLGSPSDRAQVLNSVARMVKNTGDPDRAITIFQRALNVKGLGPVQQFWNQANLLNALRLSGRLQEARVIACALMESPPNHLECQAYALYWNGVLRADAGDATGASAWLRQAQVLFEDLDEPKRYEGMGRAYAHLAQLEIWLGHTKVALRLSECAADCATRHGQRREAIFSARLRGTARMRLGDTGGGRNDLDFVRAEARACRYFEEHLASTIALADLERRAGHATRAMALLDDELLIDAMKGKCALLLADFHNARCRVYRDQKNETKARTSAQHAFRAAWCDGTPSSYHWGLEEARQHLAALGDSPPDLAIAPPLDPEDVKTSPESLELLTDAHRARASRRVAFSEFHRRMTGAYRYVPTKFAPLLGTDWNAVRSLAMGGSVELPPRFLEIHVDNRCNLSCVYCRGELRHLPRAQAVKHLKTSALLTTLDEVVALNPAIFIRFSGLIGEPLLHPDIERIFDAVSLRHVPWGLTTNGVRLTGDSLLKVLMGASYVHVSIDAGTDATYAALKAGRPGDFGRVIRGIELVREYRGRAATPQLVVSYLLQDENWRELESLASRVKAAGAETLEIKMQHFDRRRHMSSDAVHDAFGVVRRVRDSLVSDSFQVVAVQDTEAIALAKISEEPIPFTHCYANELGQSGTISATGDVQACCQYYQRTLGSMGSIENGFATAWQGPKRRDALRLNPQKACQNCSPSDDLVNRFVSFLKTSQAVDPAFLDWVQREAVSPVQANPRRSHLA